MNMKFDMKLEAIEKKLSELGRVGADAGGIEKAWKDVEALRSKLATVQAQTLALDPTGKNYDEELSRLATVRQALDSSIRAAADALTKAMDAAELAAIHENNLHDAKKAADALDLTLIKMLSQVGDVFAERYKLTEELAQRVDILRSFAYKHGRELAAPFVGFPWGEGMPLDDRKALGVYVNRWLNLREVIPPPEDGDLLRWIATRRW